MTAARGHLATIAGLLAAKAGNAGVVPYSSIYDLVELADLADMVAAGLLVEIRFEALPWPVAWRLTPAGVRLAEGVR
jgi:hypothetical protein